MNKKRSYKFKSSKNTLIIKQIVQIFKICSPIIVNFNQSHVVLVYFPYYTIIYCCQCQVLYKSSRNSYDPSHYYSYDKNQFFDLFYRWRHPLKDRQGFFTERCVSLSFGYPSKDLLIPMISIDIDDDSIPNVDSVTSTEHCMNLYVGEKYSHRLEEIYNKESVEIKTFVTNAFFNNLEIGNNQSFYSPSSQVFDILHNKSDLF